MEGLAGDRFAIITKTHHCMIDGVGSADLMVVIDGQRIRARHRAEAEALARRGRRRRALELTAGRAAPRRRRRRRGARALRSTRADAAAVDNARVRCATR